MSRIFSGVVVLGLALAGVAVPCGSAQQKPEKAPPALPGQKGGSPNPTPEASAVGVEIVNTVPTVDRENLKGYWPGVANRTGQHWQRMVAAKTAAGSDVVTILGWIHTDGRVTGLKVEHTSGKAALDRAAMNAISGSAPFDAFPYGIGVEQVKVRFSFGTFSGAPGTTGAPPLRPVH